MHIPFRRVLTAPLRIGGLVAAVLLVAVMSTPATPAPAAQVADPRYFPETGLRIEDDHFWAYFKSHGGTRTFGFPVSNAFQLLGSRVQIFQRHVMQLRPDGSVSLLNLMSDLLPYTRINGATLPAVDPEYVAVAPDPADLAAALAFVRERVPNAWSGRPVNFLAAYEGSVLPEEAFPGGPADPTLLFGFALELWGVPTSPPTPDPNNPTFVYQRFQRGVLHYDGSLGQTSAMLLGDAFKAVLTGTDLSPDLEAQARGSRFYRQFAPEAPGGLARPGELPGTSLVGAFPFALPVATLLQPARQVEPTPTATPPSANATPTVDTTGIWSPDVCAGDEQMLFVPPDPYVGTDVYVLVTSARRHDVRTMRLTGPLKPGPIMERPGMKGWVYESVIPITTAGRHVWRFYTDGARLCVQAEFVAQPVFGATATPRTTAEPTETPAPTETPEPTAVPSATPQIAVVSRSTASRSPAQQTANKQDTITITVTLLDSLGRPVPGKLVRVTSSRENADVFLQGTDQWTDSQGQVIYTVTSCQQVGESMPATSFYTIEDRSDGVTLNDRPSVAWTTGEPCSGPTATATATPILTATPTPTRTPTATPTP